MKIRSSKLFYAILSVILVMAMVVNVAFAMTAEVPSGNVDDGSENPDDWNLDDIVLNKFVTENPENDNYILTLESYIKGDATVEVIQHPADVVLLLDQSSSMLRSKVIDEEGEEISSQVALKRSVVKFIDSMAENYKADSSDHRMAIATFDEDGYKKADWTALNAAGTTSLKQVVNGLPESRLNSGTFIDKGMNVAANLITDAKDGGLYSYDNKDNTLERKKIVIVFSDGSPGIDVFNMDVANSALKTASALKKDGVIMFTVGLLETADEDELYATESVYGDYDFKSYATTGAKGESWSEDENTKTCSSDTGRGSRSVELPASNRFFNMLSSNYNVVPDGKTLGESDNDYLLLKRTNTRGTDSSTSVQKEQGYDTFTITGVPSNRAKDGDYYLAAVDATKLDQLFKIISSWIGTALTDIELHKDASIRDIISNYFTLSQYVEDASDIKKQISYCTGLNEKDEFTWSAPVNASETVEGKDINITILDLKDENDRRDIWVDGFDFTANCVSAVRKDDDVIAVGCKLILSFEIDVIDDFYGGNNIPTNAEGSGIYDKSGKSVKPFPPPHVNIQIPEILCKLELQYDEVTMYRGNKVSIDYIFDTAFSDNPLAFDFVDRKVEVSDEFTTEIIENGDFAPIKTTNYEKFKVKVTLTPKSDAEDGSVGKKATTKEASNEDAFTIYVLEPSVDVALTDTVCAYDGTTAYNYGDGANADVSVSWKDPENPTKTATTGVSTIFKPFDEDDIDILYSSTEHTSGNPIGKKDFSVSSNAFLDNETAKAMLINEYGEDKWEAEFNKLLESGETQVRVSKCAKVSYKTTCTEGCTDKTDGTYKVHVKMADLTINNVGGKPTETFVYTVLKDGKPYTKVSVQGGEKTGVAAKLSELPVGKYTVVADDSWSWRYNSKFKDDKNEVTLTKDHLSDSVTCENTELGKTWVGAVSALVKNVFAKGAKS